MISASQSAITRLDGKTLEGGGQLLRLALSLSCLTGRAIRVTDIRGNRTRGRGKQAAKGGGLKSSHYECARWLARAANAQVDGLHVGSSELLFQPRATRAQAQEDSSDFDADFDAVFDKQLTLTDNQDNQDEQNEQDIAGTPDLTADEAASGAGSTTATTATRREHEIAAPRRLTITQKTPGAVYLIVQALLPYLLLGPSCLPRKGENTIPDVVVRIAGGTNVSHSPSHEYATQVLFPTLEEHAGLPPIRSTLLRRGWSTAALRPGGFSPAPELGEVLLSLKPVEPGRSLAPFTLTEDQRGDLHSFDVSVVASPASLLQEIESSVHSELNGRFPGVTVQTVVKEDSGKNNRVYVLVVAKVTSNDPKNTGKLYRLGRDALLDGKDKARKGLAVQIARAVVRDISSEVAHGGCVDEHMHDQLVVFQALASGRSKVTRGTSPASLHTQTARWVAEELLDGLNFKPNGRCDGIGFVAGGTG